MRAQAVTLILLAAALLAAGPSGAEPVEPDFAILDVAGDVRPATLVGEAPTPATAPTPYTDSVDLRALRVLYEDELTLRMALEVQDLSSAIRNSDATKYISYQFMFRLGNAPVEYRLSWGWIGATEVPAVAGTEPSVVQDRVCVRATGDSAAGGFRGCQYQAATVTKEPLNNRFVIEVPKASLLGINPPPEEGVGVASLPLDLPVDTPITGFHAVTTVREVASIFVIAGAFVWLQDQLPDTGPATESYGLAVPAANTKIRLSMPAETQASGNPCFDAFSCNQFQPEPTPGVAVIPGQSNAVTLEVTNTLDVKRLVNLTVEIAAGSTSWKAKLAPAIEVPAHGTRSATLLINASQSLQHMDQTTMYVHARSLGHEDEVGYLALRVVASVPPGPQNPDVYFHAAPGGEGGTTAELPICGTVACDPPRSVWLNTLATDARGAWDQSGYESVGLYSLLSTETTLMRELFILDTPLATDLVMNAEKPVTGELHFKARSDLAIIVTTQLLRVGQCSFGSCDYEFIGSATNTATVGSSDTAVPFSFPIDPAYARIVKEGGGNLGIYVIVRSPDAVATGNAADGLTFIPAGSKATLPIDVDENSRNGGPSLLGLYPASDVEEFVNPGKTRAFYVLVGNEGVDTDRVEITTGTEAAGWGVAVKPASKYQLRPGETVNLTVLVTAPKTAAEGDRVLVDVTATSLNRTDDSRSLELFAIATKGVELDDEAENFETDPEAEDKIFAEPEGDSPAPGAMVLVLLAAAVAVAHRRRD